MATNKPEQSDGRAAAELGANSTRRVSLTEALSQSIEIARQRETIGHRYYIGTDGTVHDPNGIEVGAHDVVDALNRVAELESVIEATIDSLQAMQRFG